MRKFRAEEAGLIRADMRRFLEIGQEEIEIVLASVPGGADNVQEICPLSPLQEGVLFHHMLNERAGTYVLSTLFELQSHEALCALIEGLQAVIRRHQILRTAVIWEKLPRPVQVVYRAAKLPVAELTLDPDQDPILQLERSMDQGFDIRCAPMMRLRTAVGPRADRYYALLQRHHIAFDHQSWNAIFSETLACMQGRERDLPAPRPYRDYVAWALAQGKERETRAHFRARLEDWEEPSAPFGLLNVHQDGSEIEEARRTLDGELAARLRTEAQRRGMSAARLIHAAWALVVARTTGRDDVVFGTVLAASQRSIASARGTPGLFVNTLPLRVRVANATADELLEQVHRELTELSQHQQAPLSLVQRCARTGSAPLFTAVLNYRHSAGHSVLDATRAQASTLGVSVLAQRYRTNYPITLVVDDLGVGFTLTAQTDRSIDPDRFLGYVEASILALVEAWERGGGSQAYSLSILPQRELRQVLEQFNATGAEYPKSMLVHELFEQQARRTPNVPALLHGSRSLTFAQLNASANRLAARLRKKGIGPDRPVAICVDRSVEMAIGLLAILKAGAAYVPLDPNYPLDRLRYMLEDADPKVVLTQSHLKELLAGAEVELLVLDQVAEDVAGNSADFPVAESGFSSESLLYVIYTSGSTGRPKGIAMPHRSMVNLIEWHRRHLPLRAGTRVLQFAALSFDVAFQEIFSTLCLGGTLVLLDEQVRKDAAALTQLLNAQAVERLFVPPLMLQAIAESFGSTRIEPAMLRDVIVAGEQLRITPEIVELFRELNGCRLHNHYGPTETHVVTALTLSGDPCVWPSRPSIGRPIDNTRIHVLDKRRQVVPLGVVGEIYIGGANVSRGYLGRAELTAERFIADPFSSDVNARLYKTGDSGRWLADGAIEYLGRRDNQVKIRGFRIELGEVEARLSAHAQVKDAVVTVHESAAGEARLVAYVTAQAESELSVDELRAWLRSALPGFMVPSAFVVLDRLPLTPSGKLDRRSLPTPDAEAYKSDSYEAPRGEVEAEIAAIWRKLLRIERVGRHDNFLDLGGHSLLATRVVSHINKTLDVTLSVGLMFERPTVRELAEAVLQEIETELAMEAP